MPHIQGPALNEVLQLQNTITLRRLWIDNTSSGGGLTIGPQGDGSLVEQARMEGGEGSACLSLAHSATLADSLCRNRANGNAALAAESPGLATGLLKTTVRNVTAIAGQDENS